MMPDWNRLMRIALRAARRGHGNTGPNPLVGAVVAKDGRVVSVGFHARVGGAHAETAAFAAAKDPSEIRGADLVVTLEPCSRQGRTPPCVDEILKRGIQRVVVGVLDPNPAERGRGVSILRNNGVEVIVGVEEELCRRINEPYFKHVTTRLPFVTLKLACSLDGRIATGAGDARWISGPVALRRVHELRRDSNAVLIGANTAVRDDPELTVRHARPQTHPMRVIVSSKLELPLSLKLFRDQERNPTIVFTTQARDRRVQEKLEALGVKVLISGTRDSWVDLSEVLAFLGGMGVSRLLVEGGGKLAGSLLAQSLVDRIVVFYSPVVIGEEGKPSFAWRRGDVLAELSRYGLESVKRCGGDIMAVYRTGPGYWKVKI